jgi:hypothetical protein
MGLGSHHRFLPRPVVSPRRQGGCQQYLSYLSSAFQGSGLSLSRAVILSASQSNGLRRVPLLLELPGLRDVLSSSEEEHIPNPSKRATPMATAHPQPAPDSLDTA